jgi:hypothetical protein
MTVNEIINCIIAKLHPQSRVTFTYIGLTASGYKVQFAYGHHRYHIPCTPTSVRIEVREICEDGNYENTMHSRHVEGVLNGLTRNEAGEFVAANEQAD